jgi:archaellum biogenesis protein FlaJ (TadC family)
MLTSEKIFNYLTMLFAIVSVVLAVYVSRLKLNLVIPILFIIATLMFYYISRVLNKKELTIKNIDTKSIKKDKKEKN